MGRLEEIRKQQRREPCGGYGDPGHDCGWCDRQFLLAKLDEAVGFLRRHVCVQVDGGECDVCTFLRSLEQEGGEG